MADHRAHAMSHRPTSMSRSPPESRDREGRGLNGPKWRPGILDISLVSGSGANAVHKQGVKGPGGRRIDADYRITSYEPGRSLAFTAIAGPVRPTGSYTFEDAGGETRLTFRAPGGARRDQEVAHERRRPEDHGSRGRGHRTAQDRPRIGTGELDRQSPLTCSLAQAYRAS